MSAPDLRDLLLAPRLDRIRVAELLSPFGLTDSGKADDNLQSAAGDPNERLLLADIIGDLLSCVAESANPGQALTYFERFAQAAASRPHLFTYLRNSRQALELLAKCLGGSAYMSEILIRDPHHFYWVADPQTLAGLRSKADLALELAQTLQVLKHEDQQLAYLRAFKRREMLHIGVRDILRVSSVEETLDALSVLAEVLVAAAQRVCAAALRRAQRIPSKTFSSFTILAMGKLGGGELNFSSDVDLMFLYPSNDEEAPGISAPEYFRQLAQKITSGLSTFTSEGYVYRVDLRLRPEGDAGNLADPLAAYERYYRTRMGAWERLALLKAWPISGDMMLGQTFLAMSRSFIYEPPFDAEAAVELRDMKARLDEKVLARGQGGRNVKLGTGGIREIELVVQSLQAMHGARLPGILDRNTLRTLDRLRDRALIAGNEFETLRSAYLFLRDVENKLQMVDDAQTHSLPRELEELAACARLLGYAGTSQKATVDRFLHDLRRHTGNVSGLFEKFVGRGRQS